MKWVKVPDVVYTEAPFIKKVRVNDKSLCLVGYEGKIYALGSRCPHANEDITRGWCTEGKLVCPIHRFSYSLENGRGSPGQGDYIPVYPVKVETNGVYIGFNSWKEKLKQLFK